MISRHAFYEDAFMVLSHVSHPLRRVALCFLGVPGLKRIFCCNKMEKTCYCRENVYITPIQYVKCCKKGLWPSMTIACSRLSDSGENGSKKSTKNSVRTGEREWGGACKHCFNTSFRYTASGIPSDWSIFDNLLQHLHHSLGFTRAE